MLTTRYPVDFAYTHQELDALFHIATEEDVEKDGRDDARSARKESETIGAFDVHWDPLAVYDIETNEGFSLEDLLQELGRLELKALERVEHGDVPPATEE